MIVTSAYSEYALEGFELDVIDYLLKPFSFERFLKAINKVKKRLSGADSSDFVFIKSDKEYFQVKKSEIHYIKADDDFSRVYCQEKMYLDRRTLKNWSEELPDGFIRIHRSYIINRNYVSKIAGNRVFLDQLQLPIGRSYREMVLAIVE